MSNCSECQRLKYRVDVAAAISVETAAYFLRLDGNGAESPAAIVEMRRAKQELDDHELRYQDRQVEHANRARLSVAS